MPRCHQAPKALSPKGGASLATSWIAVSTIPTVPSRHGVFRAKAILPSGIIVNRASLPTSISTGQSSAGRRTIDAVAANYSIDLEAALAGPGGQRKPDNADDADFHSAFRPVVVFVLQGAPRGE